MKINLKLLTIFRQDLCFFQLYQSVLYALIGTEKYSDCSQISFEILLTCSGVLRKFFMLKGKPDDFLP